MPKSDELQKHTLNLFVGDFDELQALYPDLGASYVIRRLVRSYLDQIRNQDEVDVKVEVKI